MQIDLLDHRNFIGGHPHEQYDWLRANAPVYWHPEPEGTGFWVITRHQDVYDIGRDAATYSNEPTISIDDPSPEQAGLLGPYKMMLTMDPPRTHQLSKTNQSGIHARPSACLQPAYRGTGQPNSRRSNRQRIVRFCNGYCRRNAEFCHC